MTDEELDNYRRGFLISGLRRLTYKWPPRSEALKKQKIDRGKYKCQGCGEIKRRKDVQIDHIEAIVGLTGFTNWDNYIKRMFCAQSGLQVLCQDKCHKEKTERERQIREGKKKRKRKK